MRFEWNGTYLKDLKQLNAFCRARICEAICKKDHHRSANSTNPNTKSRLPQHLHLSFEPHLNQIPEPTNAIRFDPADCHVTRQPPGHQSLITTLFGGLLITNANDQGRRIDAVNGTEKSGSRGSEGEEEEEGRNAPGRPRVMGVLW